MNKVLCLYDLSGKVWGIVYDADEAPQGIPSIWVDLPDNAVINHIDVATKTPVFDYLPETDLGQLQIEVRNLEQNVTESQTETTSAIGMLTTDASAKGEDITNLQLALAEVYELVAGGLE